MKKELTKTFKKMPDGWRKGQTVFNFLEWLQQKGYVQGNQNQRMGRGKNG